MIQDATFTPAMAREIALDRQSIYRSATTLLLATKKSLVDASAQLPCHVDDALGISDQFAAEFYGLVDRTPIPDINAVRE